MLQVYQAMWNSTPVAAKLLLGPEMASENDVDTTVQKMLSPPSPAIESLKQVHTLHIAHAFQRMSCAPLLDAVRLGPCLQDK